MNTKCRVKTHFLQKEKKKEKEGRREGDEGKEGGREKKRELLLTQLALLVSNLVLQVTFWSLY